MTPVIKERQYYQLFSRDNCKFVEHLLNISSQIVTRKQASTVKMNFP